MTRLAAGRDDRGFTIMEVVVAMSVFAVFVAASLGVLMRTTQTTHGNLRRTAATNIALRYIEAARGANVFAIPTGRVTTTETMGNLSFTVTQNARYVPATNSGSVCAGTANTLAYKLVTITVTWPNMGAIKPVRTDTLKAVGIGKNGVDPSKGSLAIEVVGSTGTRLPGVTVSISNGQSMNTDDDGCVVFTNLPPATYTASVNTMGYVSTANRQAHTTSPIGVSAGTMARGSVYYDTARTLNIAFGAPAGATIVSGWSVRLGNTYIAETVYPTCTGGVAAQGCVTALPTTVGADLQARALYPETYTVNAKLGTCSAPVSVDVRPVTATPPTATLPVAAPTIRVQVAGTITAGRSFTVSGCGYSTSVSSTVAGSTLMLPYGTWTFTIPATWFKPGTSQAVVLSETNKTPLVTLAVAS